MLAARTIHVYLVALNLLVYQAVRQTLGMLIVPMSAELGYSISEKGWLLAAPSCGAVFTQLIGGQVTCFLGAKQAVICAFAGLALTALLPLCCSIGLGAALALQVLIGVLYGPMFPANSVLLSRWTSGAEERGFAAAQGELAISLASLGIPYLTGKLEETLGWRACLQLIGIASAAAGVSWALLAANTPSRCWYIGDAEIELLALAPVVAPTASSAAIKPSSLPPSLSPSLPGSPTAVKSHFGAQSHFGAPVESAMGASRVLAHPAVLALFFVHAAYNLGTLTIYSWSPSYYAEALRLTPAQSKSHLMAPHVAAIGSKMLAPALGRRMRGPGGGLSLLGSRRVMNALGFAGLAISVMALPALSKAPPAYSTICFGAALFSTGLHAEGFRANYLEVTRAHVGIVSAVGNCLSSVASMAAPLLVGNLVQASGGEWAPVWRMVAAASLAAALLFGAFSTASPLEDESRLENDSKSQSVLSAKYE